MLMSDILSNNWLIIPQLTTNKANSFVKLFIFVLDYKFNNWKLLLNFT